MTTHTGPHYMTVRVRKELNKCLQSEKQKIAPGVPISTQQISELYAEISGRNPPVFKILKTIDPQGDWKRLRNVEDLSIWWDKVKTRLCVKTLQSSVHDLREFTNYVIQKKLDPAHEVQWKECYRMALSWEKNISSVRRSDTISRNIRNIDERVTAREIRKLYASPSVMRAKWVLKEAATGRLGARLGIMDARLVRGYIVTMLMVENGKLSKETLKMTVNNFNKRRKTSKGAVIEIATGKLRFTHMRLAVKNSLDQKMVTYFKKLRPLLPGFNAKWQSQSALYFAGADSHRPMARPSLWLSRAMNEAGVFRKITFPMVRHAVSSKVAEMEALPVSKERIAEQLQFKSWDCLVAATGRRCFETEEIGTIIRHTVRGTTPQ